MKEVRFDRFGPPSRVTACVEVADVGEPSSWEVVVDIEAFAINPADLAMLSGNYGTLPKPPSSIGIEGVGRLRALGSSVKGLEVGDRVMMLGNNNWAEQRKVAAATVFKLPVGADLLQLAGLKVNPATALMLLRNQVDLQPGDWVLQDAPGSSVGQAVIQLAKVQGLRTVNVIRAESDPERYRVLGADVIVVDGPDLADQVQAATGSASIKLALDAVGGPIIERLADCLADGGLVVNYGMLSGEPCSLRADQTIFRGISLKGFWLSKRLSRMTRREREDLFGEIASRILAGELHAEIAATYPIEQIRKALDHAEQDGRKGRVVVLPNGKAAA